MNPSNTVFTQGGASVTADDLNTFPQTVTTIAALRAFPALSDMTAIVEGAAVAGDGGGGFYRYSASAAGPDNGTTIIVPTNQVQGAWLRLASFIGTTGAVYVDDFGADGGNLTVDSWPAFSFCVANFPAVRFRGVSYRLSQTLVIPTGCDLAGDAFLPNENAIMGSALVFDAGVGTCVQITAGANGTARLSNAIVTRAAGLAPGGSIGVLVNNAYNIPLQNVAAVNHAQGFTFLAAAVTGISAHCSYLFTAQISDAHLVFDNWPEAYVNQCRFGSNGSLDLNCTAYVRITGGGTGGEGPNGINFSQCQFNQGINAPSYFVQWINVADTGSNALEFTFSGCHIEGVSAAIFFTDATCAILNRLRVTDCVFNCPTTPLFALNAATQPAEWSFHGNQCFVSSMALAPTVQFTDVAFSNNRFLSGGALTIPTGSLITLTANWWAGNLTISGPGNITIQGDGFTAGALVRSGTGVVSYVSATGQSLETWTPTLQFGGASTGITYSQQLGQYQVSGAYCTISFQLTLTSKGSATGVALITGLPVPVVDPGSTAPCYGNNMASLTGWPAINGGGGTSTLNLYDSQATGIQTLQDTNFTNTTVLYGTLTYRVI